MKRKARKEVAKPDLAIEEETNDQQHPVINADPVAIANYVMKATSTSGDRVPTSCNRR